MPKKRLYVITCPVCGREFTSEYKDLVKFALCELADHVVADHMDWLDKWYREHPKNWNYIKRSIARDFSNQPVIAYGGTVVRLRGGEELVNRIKRATAPSKLIGILREVVDEYKRTGEKWWSVYAITISSIVRYISAYAVEREVTVEVKPRSV